MKIAVITCLAAFAAGGAAFAAEGPPVDPSSATRAAAAATQEAQPAVAQPVPAAARTGRADKPAGTATAPRKAADRLELETTQITGNRELPKVMVIVPWKHSDIGELAGRPVNSLVDEALQPVDREVFRREIDYFDALSTERARSETRVTAGAAAAGPEK